MARRAEERVRQSRGSDLDRQRSCVRTRGMGLDRKCMYLAREGGRERGRERKLDMGCNGGCVR